MNTNQPSDLEVVRFQAAPDVDCYVAPAVIPVIRPLLIGVSSGPSPTQVEDEETAELRWLAKDLLSYAVKTYGQGKKRTVPHCIAVHIVLQFTKRNYAFARAIYDAVEGNPEAVGAMKTFYVSLGRDPNEWKKSFKLLVETGSYTAALGNVAERRISAGKPRREFLDFIQRYLVHLERDAGLRGSDDSEEKLKRIQTLFLSVIPPSIVAALSRTASAAAGRGSSSRMHLGSHGVNPSAKTLALKLGVGGVGVGMASIVGIIIYLLLRGQTPDKQTEQAPSTSSETSAQASAPTTPSTDPMNGQLAFRDLQIAMDALTKASRLAKPADTEMCFKRETLFLRAEEQRRRHDYVLAASTFEQGLAMSCKSESLVGWEKHIGNIFRMANDITLVVHPWETHPGLVTQYKKVWRFEAAINQQQYGIEGLALTLRRLNRSCEPAWNLAEAVVAQAKEFYRRTLPRSWALMWAGGIAACAARPQQAHDLVRAALAIVAENPREGGPRPSLRPFVPEAVEALGGFSDWREVQSGLCGLYGADWGGTPPSEFHCEIAGTVVDGGPDKQP